MLRSPKSVRDSRAAIFDDLEAGKIASEKAAEHMLEVEPDSPYAHQLLGMTRLASGDTKAAEPLLWKALEGRPCSHEPYLALAEVQRRRDPEGLAGKLLLFLAVSKLGFAEEIPEQAAEIFTELGDDVRSPQAYAALAEGFEAAIGATPWPERFLAYRLLNEVQRQAAGGLDPDLLREVIDHATVCAPLFRAALRQWADREWMSADHEASALLIALLGETEGADLIDDLLEIDELPTWAAMRHVHWAMHRVGQRFPAAAFDKFRAAAQGAPVDVRAMMAEQIYMLPKMGGVRQALLDLLDGFETFAKDPDAPYLLLTVATLSAMLGSARESLPILERHTRMLSREGRQWVGETMDSEEGFLPDLIAAGIDELTIEHVCLDRALMDDGEDDHEDEDEDFIEPAIAEPKPGRNDPCWCGSGKKYKKCHLAADEEAERSDIPAPAQNVFGKVFNDLLQAAPEWHGRAGFEDASRTYFDRDPLDMETASIGESGFFEWYFVDYHLPSTGRTIVEEYLRRRGPRLPADERALLESWRAARHGIWEVQRVEPGRGVELKNLFDSATVFVHDVSTSKSAALWDCIVTYIHELDGKWLFVGNGTLLARPLLDRVREIVDAGSREAGVTPAEFVRSRSHEWRRVIERLHAEQFDALRIVNAEGDPLELCSAEYEVSDPDRVAAALSAAEMFEETTSSGGEPGVRSFGWMESGAVEGGRRSYGHIEIGGGKLRLECNSRRRLGIGRQLIEKHGGEFVRHIGDTFLSQEELKKQAKGRASAPGKAANALPPELEREIVQKVLAEHYAKWPDEPLPALGGRTPRQAVRSAAGRRAVEELLRDFENSAAKDGPAFDFTPLRRSLGL